MTTTETDEAYTDDGCWMENYPRHLVEAIAAGGKTSDGEDTPARSIEVARAELERRDQAKTIGTITLIRNKKLRTAPWHVYRPKDGDVASGNGKGICGITVVAAEWEADVDQRTVAHAGHPVCVNCLDRLTASKGSGIVQFQPTRRRPTVATSTERKKARSEALLDPTTYEDQTIERLEQERTTINNRLSGLGTQIKRHTAAGATDKADQATNRRDDLIANRTILVAAIAGKKAGAKTSVPLATGDVADALVASTRRPARNRSTATRKLATRKKAAAKKTTSRKKTASKKTTARKVAGATRAKRSAAKKTTTRKTARRK
jgi:hypothetical protein